jgi:hypothetical protein
MGLFKNKQERIASAVLQMMIKVRERIEHGAYPLEVANPRNWYVDKVSKKV